jgi:hypothetical protein
MGWGVRLCDFLLWALGEWIGELVEELTTHWGITVAGEMEYISISHISAYSEPSPCSRTSASPFILALVSSLNSSIHPSTPPSIVIATRQQIIHKRTTNHSLITRKYSHTYELNYTKIR